jgi:anaerobic magnesium-protoporphyrin IX monomethyl ester cyclase
MNVTFASVGYAELLGLEMLSAVLLEAGHTTSLVHDPALFDDRFNLSLPSLARLFDQRDAVVKMILDRDPDLLAFSAVTGTYAWALDIARRVREERHIPTIIGGTHPSAVPEHAIAQPQFDFVCQGEGEEAILALVRSLGSGGDGTGIPNIWTRVDGRPTPPPTIDRFIQNLDSLPFPDKTLYRDTLPRRGMYSVITSRGCPYRCSFCFNSHFASLPDAGRPKEYLRRRSPEDVLQEMVQEYARDAYTYVEFHDDVFTADVKWLRSFLPRYRDQVGVPFGCSVHARLFDAERAALLADAGCCRVKMGVQSLDNAEYRRRVLRRTETEAHVLAAIGACRALGLRIEVDHIIGLPGESEAGRRRALEVYADTPPDRVGTYWLSWLPGTEMTENAVRDGLLSERDYRAIAAGEVLGYHQAQGTAEERGHAIALQLLPLLPRRARGMLSAKVLGRVPAVGGAARLAMAGGMLAATARGGGQDALAYVRYYGLHLRQRRR